jgi:hypothetical protein
LGGFEIAICKKPWVIVAASIHKKRYAFYLLTGFTPSVIKNMAQGSVFRGHYSNQFDSNDPQQLALALFIYHLADLLEPLHLKRLISF